MVTILPPPPPGELSLAIEAPSQYPAGVAVTAYLTMTNTSKANATNLVYTVPAPDESGNYTGVTITPYPKGAGEDCTNIAAGASCMFTAEIPAGSKPGSFTVIATPNGKQNTKTTQSSKSLQDGSISVTANLGLVDVPNTGTPFYILPEYQTVIASPTESTIAYVSVMVRAEENFNVLKLVDESGNVLNYRLLGNSVKTGLNNVNSYAVSIPAGKTIQHVQAFSYLDDTPVCATSNECSNDADVNLGESGIGILTIQPNYFAMSPTYKSQVVTVSNVGSGAITDLVLPGISEPFSMSGNTCQTSLAAGSSCQFVVNYTPSEISDTITYIVDYNNGKQTVNTTIDIPYIGNSLVKVARLNANSDSISLNKSNLQETISLENTGEAELTNLILPSLSSPLQLISTTCVNGQSLAVHQTCSYTIGYSGAPSDGLTAVNFGYNNGQVDSTTPVAVDWTELVSTSVALSLTSGSVSPFESVEAGQQFFAVFTQDLASSVLHSYTTTFESQVYSCNITAGQTSCSTPLTSGTGGLKPVQFNATQGNVILSPESVDAPINGIWAYVSGTKTPGAAGIGSVKTYALNVFNGELNFVRESDIGYPWASMLFAPNGTTMYVGLSYNGSNSTLVYKINTLTGEFSQVQDLISQTATGVNSLAFAGESTLVYYGSGQLFSYSINNDGTLNQVSEIQLGVNYCGTGSIRYGGFTVSPSNDSVIIGCYASRYDSGLQRVVYENMYIVPFTVGQDHALTPQNRYTITGGSTASYPPAGLYMSSESLIMTALDGQIYTFGFDGATITAPESKNIIGGAAGFANAGLLVPDPYGAPYLYTVKNVAAGSYPSSIFGIDIANQSASTFSLTPSIGVNPTNAAIFDPSGKYFYTTSFIGQLNNSQIFQFSYESNTHTFTPLAIESIPAEFGQFIRTIAISGKGNY